MPKDPANLPAPDRPMMAEQTNDRVSHRSIDQHHQLALTDHSSRLNRDTDIIGQGLGLSLDFDRVSQR